LTAGECFGWGGRKACASEAVRGVAEAGELLGAAFDYVRRERHVNTKLGGGTAK